MIKYVQSNSSELGTIDLRQANLIKKYKPDIVLFEISHTYKLPFNKFKATNKPAKEYEKLTQYLRKNSKQYPQATADIAIWENIHKLWNEGKNTLVFNIDAPDEIRSHHQSFGLPYNTARKQWNFWAYLFIRERYMVKHVAPILKKITKNQKVIVAVFIELEHWKHVLFQLSNPSKKAMWDYYFKRFPEITPKNIAKKIKEYDKTYYKYWKKVTLW
jgi:hypothetical protein